MMLQLMSCNFIRYSILTYMQIPVKSVLQRTPYYVGFYTELPRRTSVTALDNRSLSIRGPQELGVGLLRVL